MIRELSLLLERDELPFFLPILTFSLERNLRAIVSFFASAQLDVVKAVCYLLGNDSCHWHSGTFLGRVRSASAVGEDAVTLVIVLPDHP